VSNARIFTDELRQLLNRHSMENGSNTPDFLLSQYLTDCLIAYNKVAQANSQWHGGTEGERPARIDCVWPDESGPIGQNDDRPEFSVLMSVYVVLRAESRSAACEQALAMVREQLGNTGATVMGGYRPSDVSETMKSRKERKNRAQ
jgi:hypothetical protein